MLWDKGNEDVEISSERTGSGSGNSSSGIGSKIEGGVLSRSIWNTLTWPLSSPLSSLFGDPMATIEPSEERLTDRPDLSSIALP